VDERMGSHASAIRAAAIRLVADVIMTAIRSLDAGSRK
jgi:hypothetical protein